MSDVSFAFGLTPTKAIEFLQAKKAVLDGVDTVERLISARGRAARIANLSSLEMTKDLYQSLIEAQQQGLPFEAWKKNVMAMLHKKGWVAGYEKDGTPLIADPKTGEYFGKPWRLNTIYRTNTQAAYSAQRYQQMRDNVDSRPYWQYSSVNDDRTRPSHSAMNGLVYRYDDPFWHTFYPPNGFNCRCTVIALAERDIKRRGLNVESSEGRLVEYPRKVNEFASEPTIAFKLNSQQYVLTDRGFDYNIGRTVYRPNLDLYPETLAHQFAKREMGGEAFKADYQLFERDFQQQKAKLGIEGKVNAEQLVTIRNQLRREYKFAAGIISQANQALLGIENGTVWLSDDTLIKQLNSRSNDDFDVSDYSQLPDLIYQSEFIVETRDKHFQLFKEIETQKYTVILKILENEVFVQSFRKVSQREWNKFKTDR